MPKREELTKKVNDDHQQNEIELDRRINVSEAILLKNIFHYMKISKCYTNIHKSEMFF